MACPAPSHPEPSLFSFGSLGLSVGEEHSLLLDGALSFGGAQEADALPHDDRPAPADDGSAEDSGPSGDRSDDADAPGSSRRGRSSASEKRRSGRRRRPRKDPEQELLELLAEKQCQLEKMQQEKIFLEAKLNMLERVIPQRGGKRQHRMVHVRRARYPNGIFASAK